MDEMGDVVKMGRMKDDYEDEQKGTIGWVEVVEVGAGGPVTLTSVLSELSLAKVQELHSSSVLGNLP